MSRPSSKYFEIFAQIPNVTFVETGLYRGDGVDAALRSGFKKIYSIEPVQEFIDKCTVRFKKHVDSGSVKLVQGGSETELKKVLDEVTGPVVYWLDGHFQGVKQGEEENCPLNKEIDAILARADFSRDVILIDDLRLVKDQKRWRGHNAELTNIISKLVSTLTGHVTLYFDGHEKNDVLGFIPLNYLPPILPLRIMENT
ncbi:MAG: hypothetical protein LW629_10090 [Burkholderiales bacterium]|jgi:hypothetical protein|nr:hypothetical protein [Burkholderiales bacterium]